jgi:hypothetical protein
MSAPVDIRADIEAAKKIRFPKWTWLPIIFGSVPIYWLFDHFGQLNIALPVLNFILVLCFIVFVKRRLLRRGWFWLTMTVIVAAHVPLFMFVPWTTRWMPALIIAVVDSADFCLMLWIISAVGKFMKEPEVSEG